MLIIGETWYGACGKSVLSSQFFCKSKTVLKNNVYETKQSTIWRSHRNPVVSVFPAVLRVFAALLILLLSQTSLLMAIQ